eukprot:6251569-Pyramimonas_sp.AAC.1
MVELIGQVQPVCESREPGPGGGGGRSPRAHGGGPGRQLRHPRRLQRAAQPGALRRGPAQSARADEGSGSPVDPRRPPVDPL